MTHYEAQELKFRCDPEYATNHSCPVLRTRHDMQRQSCWSVAEKVEMIDTCFQGWTCPPIYVINHLELTEVAPDGEDHVFDGAHKLEAVFEFMAGKFPLKATPTSCAEIKEHTGKFFEALPLPLKTKIRKYRFVFNVIDDETAHDPERLRTLWQRLNRAGKKLNSYELEIPVIRPLIVEVLKPGCDLFKGTVFFPKEESHRGDLEQRLEVVLAMADMAEPTMGSQTALIAEWHATRLGDTMAKRTESVTTHGGEWREILLRAHKMLEDLRQLNVFCDATTGEPDLDDTLRKTELPFVLGRLARRFPTIEAFRSQKVVIATRLRADIFSKTVQALSLALGGTGRNGTFQKMLFKYVDRIVSDLAGIVQRRLFTKTEKTAKLKAQGGLCAACNTPILKHQLKDGDHVVEWSEGGETTMENLQILHRHCHQAKTAAGGAGSSAV
jgi:hypothetical protein